MDKRKFKLKLIYLRLKLAFRNQHPDLHWAEKVDRLSEQKNCHEMYASLGLLYTYENKRN